MIRVVKTSPLTGLENSMTLDITQDMIDDWKGGMIIQDAMPHIQPHEREFLISGLTQEDWDDMMSESDE